MKYLAASGLSAMFFLGIISPTVDANFWQKLLYKREDTKEQKKKEYKITIIIWALFTIVVFVFVTFFID